MLGTRPVRALILVVEDELATARALVELLEAEDYQVHHALDGRQARAETECCRPDLILLDLTLPDVDGLVLCSVLKTMAPRVPIVVCSATARRSDPVLALKLGADDFIRKPFEMDDLLARIEAVLRRAPRRPPAPAPPRPPELRVGDLVVEESRRRSVLGGKVLPLTPTEFNLLIVLAKHSNTLVARDRLAQEVWGPVDSANSRAVDVHMRRLRAKLAHAAVNGPWIVSVRGLGYRLTADDPAKNAA